MFPPSRVSEIGVELQWHEDDLKPGTMVVVERGTTVSFAEVRGVDKKRNCRLLLLDVESSYYSDSGTKISSWRVDRYPSWKKLKGSKVYRWITLRHPQYAPPDPELLKKLEEEKRLEEERKRKEEEERRVRAESRRLYKDQRRLLQLRRHSMSDCFTMVGLTMNSSEVEYKEVRKKVMLRWHPDRLAFRPAGMTEEQYLAESKKHTDALAEVRGYLSVVWGTKN